MEKIIAASICSLFYFSISQAQLLTNKSIWYDGMLTEKRVPDFRFMDDGVHYTRLEGNAIVKYNFLKEKKGEILLDKKLVEEAMDGSVDHYAFSANEQYILLESGREKIYRRSYYSDLYLYDRSSSALKTVTAHRIRAAEMDPAERHISYVAENDLYMYDIKAGQETRITRDGEKNAIINGHADWVYEEEFAITSMHCWSPDGRYLAWVRLDESEVPVFHMKYYRDSLYPVDYAFKYPKVGEANSTWTLHLYDTETGVQRDITPEDAMHYIPRLRWTPGGELCITQMNRHQNNLQLHLYSNSESTWSLLYEESSPYYLDINDALTFLTDGSGFIWMSPKSGHTHLYLMDMQGEEKNAITAGDYPVTAFYGVDEKERKLYYQAAKTNATQRELYVYDLDEGSSRRISQDEGYHNGSFNSTYTHYIDHYGQLNRPTEHHIHQSDGTFVRTLEDNDELRRIQEAMELPGIEFMRLKSAASDSLNGYILKPQKMEEGRKYPLLMYVYGGPGSQNVTDKMSRYYWWFQMLAERGYVVACFDNRGTGGRSDAFQKQTYMELGRMETEDQIAVARQLGALSFIDRDRIGIFGWSYGAYLSTSCLLKGAETFHLAVAVAPVTNWKWYDTIYTERYMRTESENPKGYRENSPVNFAHLLEGEYMIVHGGGDDNVHPQHTHEMIRALVDENKHFEMLYYPNKNHGIYGNYTRWHLFEEISNFLEDRL